MGVNSLPKTVTRQRRDCDLNPGFTAPESSTLTSRLPSHASGQKKKIKKDIFRSVGKESGESVESVLEKKRKAIRMEGSAERGLSLE